MSNTDPDDSKKDLALIMARLSELIDADNQQKSASVSRDFTVNQEQLDQENTNLDALQAEMLEDIDENYPELTDVVEPYDEAVSQADAQMLDTLMTRLTPAIDAAVNRAIERIVLDAKQPLKQQLELEIRQQLIKLLK